MAKKKLSKRAKEAVRSNIFISTAIVSLLLNLFFIVGLVTYTSTDSLDDEVFEVAYERFCVDNYAENLAAAMEASDDPALAKATFEVQCDGGSFEPYHDAAVDAYLVDQGL